MAKAVSHENRAKHGHQPHGDTSATSSEVEIGMDIAVDLIGSRRHPLVPHVERNLKENCGIRPDKNNHKPISIVLGVSGGADSLALLLTLCSIRDRESTPLNLHAVHVNHNLRDEASQDEVFVTKLCKTLEINCTVKHIHPADEGGNIYAASRKLRYQAFKEIANRNDSNFIAVAHHADDQFETVLMNLCRGCDIDGAAGMKWKRTLDYNTDDLYLIRPLLDISKSDCISICNAAKVNWREDPSNQDCDRTRARLRADVLPVLNELWPGVAKRAASTLESILSRRDVVDAVIASAFGASDKTTWKREELAELPISIITAGLHRAASHQLTGSDGIDSIDRNCLLTVARAIMDKQMQPRTFNWLQGLSVVINSREVLLFNI